MQKRGEDLCRQKEAYMAGKKNPVPVPKPTIQRLPGYLTYLKEKQAEGVKNISATIIAEDLNLYHVQVRKDLALISDGGKPKLGYVIDDLIEDLASFLGYGEDKQAVIVGVGKLGRTLLSYGGFADYGLNIMMGFDADDRIYGVSINGKQILPIEKLPEMVKKHNILIGIITVPAPFAQNVCDLLIESGIKAIWNFAPVHLKTPQGIFVQSENMAASLAVLSNELRLGVETPEM